jgi:hypothetical protein
MDACAKKMLISFVVVELLVVPVTAVSMGDVIKHLKILFSKKNGCMREKKAYLFRHR